jgi:hypothetical protein
MLIEEQMQMMKAMRATRTLLIPANACRQQIIFDQVMADKT